MNRTAAVTALVCFVTFVVACSSDDPDCSPGTVGCPDGQPEWAQAFDATSFGWLLNVWGPSANELFAVGGTPTEGRIQRFDGQTWTRMDIGLDVPLLNWAYGFGPSDVWVVGDQGTILHYDGAWTQSATVTDQNLWGIWGASPDDLWAVGGNGRADGQATLLRYDGQSWRRIEVPPLTRASVFAFFKVWGTGPDNVYIVGQRGAVLRWNGTTFEEQLVGTSRDLIALWGTGPDRIVIVGGRANGEVVTWDGTEWRTTLLSPRPGLNGVWMGDPDVAHLVGLNGSIFRFDFETATVIEDTPDEVLLDFHAVYGDPSGGRLVAVGGNFQFVDGPFEGVAYQRGLSNNE